MFFWLFFLFFCSFFFLFISIVEDHRPSQRVSTRRDGGQRTTPTTLPSKRRVDNSQQRHEDVGSTGREGLDGDTPRPPNDERL